MKTFPLPLKIICKGFSEKKISRLADDIGDYFDELELYNDILYAIRPLSERDYNKAWKVFDRYGVKVI